MPHACNIPVEMHDALAPVSTSAYTFPGLVPPWIATSKCGYPPRLWFGATLSISAKGLIGAIADSTTAYLASVCVAATIPSTFWMSGSIPFSMLSITLESSSETSASLAMLVSPLAPELEASY